MIHEITDKSQLEGYHSQYYHERRMKFTSWVKRLGFWGFLFFLVKGLLWLLVPALLAIWSTT